MTEFTKYPKIFILGSEENKELFANPDDEIIVEEKIDGSNFRFMIKEGKIIFGSRTRSIGDSTQDIGGNWKKCVNFVTKRLNDGGKLGQIPSCFIFYGECCVKHTINYDWEKIPPYLGFNIFDCSTGKFLDHDDTFRIFNNINLPTVPCIKRTKAGSIGKISDETLPQSKYYDGKVEGLVFKNYSKQVFGKFVNEQFKEENEKVFGMGKKKARMSGDDANTIVAAYCPNIRIEKMVFKLIDNGEKLGMELMHQLPKLVIEDLMEEHWRDICLSRMSVNFLSIRKNISKRCLEVLKNMMVNNALTNAK